MCGIVGYTGSRQAVPILLEGLQKLEYRGYDSAGICVQEAQGLTVCKSKGRLAALQEKLGEITLSGGTGIGHTRWATHGAPSDRNSHPHLSNCGKIAVVHNGIIENEAILRRELVQQGITFASETDTEMVANLIGLRYAACGDFAAAVRSTVAKLEGSYALAILCADQPDTMIAVKHRSPLIFGFGEGENFIASDVPAILKHTRRVAYLNDGEMVVFTAQKAEFYDFDGNPIQQKQETITWEMSAAERGGYDHFMLKEIFEQPKALRDNITPRIRDGKVALGGVELAAEYLRNVKKIYLVACGSAYYVSTIGQYTIEKLCRIPAQAMMASEFRYCDPVVDEDTLVVIISQSGETADTLAALLEAKQRGAKTVAIVNVVGSAIVKAADHVLYTWAGPEIAVATTKAFSTQLAVVYLLALHMAQARGTVTQAEYAAILNGLEAVPDAVQSCLTEGKVAACKACAAHYAAAEDAFFIGRNVDSAVGLEGSLKLKEIAYIHSESYPAGELKHGPISLVVDGTPIVALATVEALFDKTMANIREVKARGADVLCVATELREEQARQTADRVLTVPQVLPVLQPSLTLIPLQLFAYYVAVSRGCDVDKPRNLAKSVTVE